MGTSIEMIERHYGTLVERRGREIASRPLDAFDASRTTARGKTANP